MPGHRISDFVGRSLLDGMRRLNARHPWSHNDHFHSWILANLPERCGSVLDVGCGRGELLAALAPHVGRVVGADLDAAMREQSAARCTGLANVALTDLPWNEVDGPFDAVTMVAVLHHLPVEEALRDVRRLLAPGGRFLCVGLAVPATFTDHVWDVASMVSNPVMTSEYDPLRDGGEILAGRLREANVPVTATRHLGALDGSLGLTAVDPIAVAWQDEVCCALRRLGSATARDPR